MELNFEELQSTKDKNEQVLSSYLIYIHMYHILAPKIQDMVSIHLFIQTTPGLVIVNCAQFAMTVPVKCPEWPRIT